MSVDLAFPVPAGRRARPESCGFGRLSAGHRVAVFDALDAEWAYLAGGPRLRAAAARWAAGDPALAGLADPADLLAAGQDLADQPRVAAVTLALLRVASVDPGAPADPGRVAQAADTVAQAAGPPAGHGAGKAAREVAPGVPDAVGVPGAGDPADGELAVRVLVQALLPGLKLLCARTWWVPQSPGGGSLWLAADHEERAAVALELLVAGIRGYRWRTRRGPANLNLLNDARTRLLRLVAQAREADRGLRWAADPDDAGAAHRAAPGGVDEHVYYARALAGLLRWALHTRVLSEEAVRLVAQTRLAGCSPEELAAEHGVAVHSLRRRRQRAEVALAAAARAAGRWPLAQAA